MCMEAACRHGFFFVCLDWYDRLIAEGPFLLGHLVDCFASKVLLWSKHKRRSRKTDQPQ